MVRAYVPTHCGFKFRKPFWGNLALALALIIVNGFRLACLLTAWALDRPGNLLDPRRRAWQR